LQQVPYAEVTLREENVKASASAGDIDVAALPPLLRGIALHDAQVRQSIEIPID